MRVTKKIKRIGDLFEISDIVGRENFFKDSEIMDDFVKVCNLCNQSTEEDQLFEEKIIDLKPAENVPFFYTADKPIRMKTKQLSFQISNEDILKIANQLVSIIRSPIVLAELLKDLDNALGKAMLENNIQFCDNDLPRFIIAGKTHYIPGLPPQDYRPKKKERLLDTILLMREKEHGINVEGDSPKFLGFIDMDHANEFVASGHIFTEDKQISRLLLHGSFSHRIIFEAIRCAIRSDKLSLKYGDDRELNMKQLLELLVYTELYYETGWNYIGKISQSLWTLMVDTSRDSVYKRYYLDPDHYSFSGCNPFVLNSLLLCFGEELGLRNLQHYLLDSHYKASYEMVCRVKNGTSLSMDMPDSAIYTYCMQALSIAGREPAEVGVALPFTLRESKVQNDPSFVAFDSKRPIPGIVKKIKKSSGGGQYGSWQDFFHHLNQQSIFSKTTDVVTKDVATVKASVPKK